MKDLLNRVIVAGSQQEAIGHFAEEGDELGEEAPNVIRALQNGLFDATVVLALPEKHHRWNRTTNMLERLIQKIRRREKVIRIFTSKESAWRPVGALLAEKKSTSTFRRTTR